MSSTAMINIITRGTTKKQMRDSYKSYPDTQPEGFTHGHTSTVEPIFCEIPKGSKVLDVGCNSGEMMKLLKDSSNCDVVGVDVSPKVLGIARKKGLKVFNASAEKLPFHDKSFDVVILREVLVHLHEPVRALKEIRRVLKPSGFLLGSAPHANLERVAWDDKRLHHRYYDETTIRKDLSEAFDTIHLKVLNGAQFSVGFASSLLADQPAEFLFKCGGPNLPAWEAALLSDKETLRAWFGPTQAPGTVYYRMIGFAAKMRKIKGVEIGFENFNWSSNNGCSEWQRKIIQTPEGIPASAIALSQLEKCLKVADPWVFQPTYHNDVLDFFECAKDVYKDKKFVTESDDWIFDLPSYNVASHPYKPNSELERIAFAQMKLSDALVVSTSFLKENLSQLFPDKPIHIIPNSIDFSLWDNVKGDGVMKAKGNGVVRIGFTGCGNHGGDLEIVKPVLLALLDEFPNLEVVMPTEFKCFKDITNPRFINANRWVSIIDYPSMVKGWDLDIGIAPLRDNSFNRAKSNLRWLEYSALKIPTVASRVRPFSESITYGPNVPIVATSGILCSSQEEWYLALKMLIESVMQGGQNHKTIGQNAYNAVHERFNMEKVAIQYAALLKEIRNASK